MSIGVVRPWYEFAERAQRVLVDRFWDGRRRLFRVTDRPRICRPRWHYWWQAHALDACVDVVLRTGSAAARQRAIDLVAGILRRNGGLIVNNYYDDMAWMALALLRAGDIGVAGANRLVSELWREIRGGWDDTHGGIVWRRGDTYTNTPANAPAAILATRLHQHTGAEEDLQWARRIVDWLHRTLVDPETGIVWDGLHPEREERPSLELYTYNQGTVVGAHVGLYRCTGDELYLRRAERTAGAAMARLVNPITGLLPPEGDGDRGLFKGILVRYLGDLVSEPAAGDGTKSAVLTDLRRNGVAVAPAAVAGSVGPDWARPEAGSGSLSTQLSAVLLLETLAGLGRLLPEDTSLPPPRR